MIYPETRLLTPEQKGIYYPNPNRSLWETYQSKPEWYARPESIYGIHGVHHADRVFLLMEHLMRMQVIKQCTFNIYALRFVPGLHDCFRNSDDEDLWHGARAAEFAKVHYAHLPPDAVQMIADVCHFHAFPDEDCPMSLEHQIFKDADALDRVRTKDLDPHYLRLPESQALIQPAQDLYDLSDYYSRNARNDYDKRLSVMNAAHELGIVVNS